MIFKGKHDKVINRYGQRFVSDKDGVLKVEDSCEFLEEFTAILEVYGFVPEGTKEPKTPKTEPKEPKTPKD